MQSWCSPWGNIWSYNDFQNFLMKIFPSSMEIFENILWRQRGSDLCSSRPAWCSQDKVLFVVFLLAANNLGWAGRWKEYDGNLFLMANSDNLTVINGCLNLRVVSTALTKESYTAGWLDSDVNKGRNIDFTLNLRCQLNINHIEPGGWFADIWHHQ